MATKYLVLENGMTFAGEGFGADHDVISEFFFTTSMTGYIETLTDPGFTAQGVVQTFPLLGNYGVNEEDFESDSVHPSAYIVREYCIHPSNFRSKMTLDAFLRQNDVVGLCGIDTRALTRVLRDNGTMNGIITSDPDSVDMEAVKSFKAIKPIAKVSCTEPAVYGEGERNVVLLDFGVKRSIIRELTARGCKVTVVPYSYTASEILALKPDGIMLPGGPGDPNDNPEIIATLKKLLPAKIPTMGICAGHQLLALANGFSTEKMRYGHYGESQPVKYDDGRIYVTPQSHSYALVSSSIDKSIASELFVNVNDGSNEGLIYHNAPAFTVQFHPEACGGPTDTLFLFDRFVAMIDEYRGVTADDEQDGGNK